MIKHVWTVVCSNTVIDINTNNISFYNVIEQLNIAESPKPKGVLPIHLELVTLWIRDDTNAPVKGESRVSFVNPSGEKHFAATPPVDLSEKERVRNLLRFDGIPVETSGRYYFLVEVRSNDKWIEAASVPLTVNFSSSRSEEQKEPNEDQVTEGK